MLLSDKKFLNFIENDNHSMDKKTKSYEKAENKINKEKEYKQKNERSTNWETAAKSYLMENPYCVMCLVEGNIIPAVNVCHIIAPNGNSDLFWNDSNWQSLCKYHYDKKLKQKK